MIDEEQEELLLLLRDWFEGHQEQKMSLLLDSWSDEKELITRWLK